MAVGWPEAHGEVRRSLQPDPPATAPAPVTPEAELQWRASKLPGVEEFGGWGKHLVFFQLALH